MLQNLKSPFEKQNKAKFNITNMDFSKCKKAVLKNRSLQKSKKHSYCKSKSAAPELPFYMKIFHSIQQRITNLKRIINHKSPEPQNANLKKLKPDVKPLLIYTKKHLTAFLGVSIRKTRYFCTIAKPIVEKQIRNSVIHLRKLGIYIYNLKDLNPKIKKIIYSCAVLALLIIFTGIATTSYEISIDGDRVGLVRNKNLVTDRIDQIKKKNADYYKVNIDIPSKVQFKKVMFSFTNNLSKEQIGKILDANLNIKARAYAINVNGMDIAYLKDMKSAQLVLNKLKEPYLQKKTTTENVGFLEEVKIVKREIMTIYLEKADSVYERLAKGNQGIRKYNIQKGDTISEIAEQFHVKVSEIEKANPNLDIQKIQIGQEINLTVPRYALNITEKTLTTFEQKVPYTVEYENSNSLYKGQERVKVSGTEGKKRVKAELVAVNGIVEKTVVLQEEVLQSPKTEIVLKGTKERPRTIAYGIFTRPSGGGVTSRYGMRWGSMHTGVDLGASYGSPIKAADGGKVIFSGWQGGYGQLIKIDHENGYVTYYGHCSKRYVKVGERVARGEVVAAVGSTGNVTGPHLHFEVRRNGSPVNPLNFIN